MVLDWLVFDDPATRKLGTWIESATWELVTRADVRAELAHVLTYPDLGLVPSVRDQALARYDRYAVCQPAAPPATPPTEPVALPVCRDPSDQKFLVLARDAGARWLVTRDLRLLRLARRCHQLGLFRIVAPSGLPAPDPAAPL